MDSSSLVF